MSSAFIHTPLPCRSDSRLRAAQQCERRPATMRVAPDSGWALSRREMVGLLAATAVLLRGAPARADRTGKYSTKLTAKRRYLPRIARGLDLLRAARPQHDAPWTAAVADFSADMPDLVPALKLFATTFFAEGNRIGQVEKGLATCVARLELAAKALAKAAEQNDFDAAERLYRDAASAANCYIDTAKLRETIPDLTL